MSGFKISDYILLDAPCTCVRMCHLTFIYFVSQAPLKGSVASFFASVKESDKTKCEV